MRRILLGLCFILFSLGAVAFSFPALSGRVVDDAHILSTETIQSLEQSLAAYERESTNQIVVATLPSLQGGTIDDFGYQLGRFWSIGQKGKDNGVILLVAPHERDVRIEVGYGLEGSLTDAQSHLIIQNIILPDFRLGHMDKGIVDGTQAIVAALGGKTTFNLPSSVAYSRQQLNSFSPNMLSFDPDIKWLGAVLVFCALALFALIETFSDFEMGNQYSGRVSNNFFMDFLGHFFGLLVNIFLILGLRGGSGGGSSSGGFGGGGGSFGGGGASGSW